MFGGGPSHFLVPTGFGAASRYVFIEACRLAREFRAGLTLLHVVEPKSARRSRPPRRDSGPIGFDALGLLHQSAHHIAADPISWDDCPVDAAIPPRELLERWAASPAAVSLRIEMELRQGSIVDEVLDFACTTHPSLVTLPAPATRRHRWLRRWSKPDPVPQLIEKINCPLLLMKRPTLPAIRPTQPNLRLGELC